MNANAALVLLLSLFRGSCPTAAHTENVVASQDVTPAPRPSPEHQIFKEDEGVWDVIVELLIPGAPPMVSKAVATNTIGCGGLCLITDLRSQMTPDQAFHGHGTTAYDPVKKKYVRSWTDSMTEGLEIIEATWDPGTRTLTSFVAGPDPSGKVAKAKGVYEYTSSDARVFTLYRQGPDGQDVVGMRFKYTRRK